MSPKRDEEKGHSSRHVSGRPTGLYAMLLSSPRPHRYWIFRSWGRVGTVIGSNKLERVPSKEDAIEHFMKLYEEKTGNAWHSKNFTKYPKKFYPLEIDYGQVIPALTSSASSRRKGCRGVRTSPQVPGLRGERYPTSREEYRPFPDSSHKIEEEGTLPDS